MRRHLPLILLGICGVVLILGILHLFSLRFEIGDVYPEYSSLRSDPLGTMALYESLGQVPGLTVRRDLSTTNTLPPGGGTTYFYLAAPMSAWQALPDATFDAIEQFVTSGGRLVITLFPDQQNSPRPFRDETAEPGENDRTRLSSMRERWGVDSRIIDLERDEDNLVYGALVERMADLPIPDYLFWYSGIVFANLNEAWIPIYTRESDPVLIERTFGNGSVVVSTDSYFVSNEAMLNDRDADLLSWLVGSGRNIVFEEAHFGVVEQPGVAMLIRRYRLQWFVAGLILFAALFVWKNAVSLAPAHLSATAEHHILGKDAAAGFDNLLRRSIPVTKLFFTCFTEWKKSVANNGKYSTSRIRQAEEACGTETDPVKAYQTVHRILQTKIK